MKIIGHRGARGLAPENTLQAIELALRHHADEIEVDIRTTKDNVPVLSHNSTLLVGGEVLVITRHTFAELQRRKPDLTPLTAALDLIGHSARPHIEIKPGEPTGPVVSTIREYTASGKLAASDFLVGSKSQKTLREFHRAMPDIEKVVIESWSGVRAHYRARQVGTRRVSMRSWWLWRGFLRAMHRRGYQIAPYTMNDPAKARRWQKYLYGVITDYPDRFE